MKKEIVLFTSFCIDSIKLLKKIDNPLLLSLINDIEKVKKYTKDNRILSIKDIEVNNGKFVFDILNEIKNINIFDGLYFLNEIDIGNQKIKKIDSLNTRKEVYENIIDILVNKLIRGTHINNLLFIHFQINNKYKYDNNSLIELNENEINLVNKFNAHLSMIFESLKKRVPNIMVYEYYEGVYIRDFDKRDVFIDNDVLSNISISINEFANNDYVFLNEKVHPSVNSIRYCFSKAKIINKDKLLIVFSAFSKDTPKYNYINTLSFVDCNKLFILDDYGEKGSYYLGLNGDLDIETSVASLISKIMRENNILFKDVISIGTSKGGSAALYYGMKYNYGNVIIGAPQYKIGTYLSNLSIKTYGKDIFGEINIANRVKYDNLIRLVSNNKTKVSILSSEGDNQYERVLKEYSNVAEELGLSVKFDMCNIKEHNEIAKVFPEYLINKLEKVLKIKVANKLFLYKSIRKILKYKRRGR